MTGRGITDPVGPASMLAAAGEGCGEGAKRGAAVGVVVGGIHGALAGTMMFGLATAPAAAIGAGGGALLYGAVGCVWTGIDNMFSMRVRVLGPHREVPR